MKRLIPPFVLSALVLAGLWSLQPAAAATSELFVSQSCMPSGHIRATFDWRGNSPNATQQWLDLSLFNNGWEPRTFLGNGPHPASLNRITWDGLIPNSEHFVRVNQLLPGGNWDPSPTFGFTTIDCGPVTGEPRPRMERVLAPIESVEIVRTGPGTYHANVRVGLPSGCAEQAGHEVNTAGTIIRIQIYNFMPAEPVPCTLIYRTYDLTIPFPPNLTIGELWRVDVNRRIFTFTAE